MVYRFSQYIQMHQVFINIIFLKTFISSEDPSKLLQSESGAFHSCCTAVIMGSLFTFTLGVPLASFSCCVPIPILHMSSSLVLIEYIL